ncbi:MAG: globin domain-containing protein, partial [Pseudomonadota bacterium]
TPLAAITPEQIARVQADFAQIAGHADLLAKKFYEKLFEREPRLRPLFSEDMTEQRAKLVQTLGVAIDALDHIEDLVVALEALGRRHEGYGAQPAHYAVVGEVLLETLERALGNRWTESSAAAWSAVYGALAQTMIAAAEN